jgi:hypothetical protein
VQQHEFINRIAAQRAILRVINHKPWSSEPLFGLSRKAIDRWISVNRLDPDARVVRMVTDISGTLFFLANKSQEQVSDEYQAVRAEITAACSAIERELDRPGRL